MNDLNTRKIICIFDDEGFIYTPDEFGFDESDYDSFEAEIINEVSENIGGTRYTLSVYGNGSEGPVPHFHVKKNGKGAEACLCIFEPLYFSHNNHQGELTKPDTKIIDRILVKPYKNNPQITNWEEIKREWIILNTDSFSKYRGIKNVNQPPKYEGIKFGDQHPEAKPDFSKHQLL